MSAPLNPFRPTAGAAPPRLVGREGLLDEFSYGLQIRTGAPGLLTIFTGSRGVGKTVMLGETEERAQRAGWAVISETATRGFLGRIGQAMLPLIEELGSGPPTRRITGLGMAGFSIDTELTPKEQVGWRQLGEELLRLLDDRQTGLAITLDEFHSADRDELSHLAASVQHFIRAGLPVALVLAGLPAAVADLLDDGVAPFMRRADRIDLHATTIDEVEASYREVFDELPSTIDPNLLRLAAEATSGYPFLIQLVGYHLWQVAEENEGPLKPEQVHLAITVARRRSENRAPRF